MKVPDFSVMDSDTRFEAVLGQATKTVTPSPKNAAAPKPRTLRAPDGTALADVRSTAKAVTLNIPARSAPEFGAWLNHHAQDVITELHDRWQKDRSEDAGS